MSDHALSAAGFPWDTLKAVVGGGSALDIPRLRLRSVGEAEEFLDCYGYRWGSDEDLRMLERVRSEAVSFIQEELLAGEPLAMPQDLAEQTDVRELLLLASSPDRDQLQRWACAILRVMHTVSHAQSSFEERFGEAIRAQILERFLPHVHEGAGGPTLGTGEDAIPLARFEVKSHKALRSSVMKLLHKVENVAADVFDQIGLRFVTRERFDTLLVVRYLRRNNVVMFANVKPSRSRNSLIDMEWLLGEMEEVDAQVRAGLLTDEQRLDAIRAALRSHPYPPLSARDTNQHSSIFYRSIQFTGRQLIRAPGSGGEDLRFFFPFEVQVLDQECFEASHSGLASHAVYKERQRETVRRRVLGALLTEARATAEVGPES
jgi:uncharacterized protein (TIGR04562 family)